MTKSLSQWGGFTCYCDLLGPARTSDGGHSPDGTVVSASGLASAYLSGIISSGTLLDSPVLISCCWFLLHTTCPISLVPGSSLDQLCLCMFQNSMFSHQVVSIALFLPHWLVLMVWLACCNGAVACAWYLSTCACLPQWESWAVTMSLLWPAVFYNGDTWGVGQDWCQFLQWVCYTSLRVLETLMLQLPCTL